MERVGAIVLVGGRSTRLGRNKALEVVGGRTLLQRVLDVVGPLTQEVLLVSAPGQDTAWLPSAPHIRHVPDAFQGRGPLVGICSGLLAATSDRCLAVACDMPFLNRPLLQHLLGLSPGWDAVIPRIEGQMEALHAVYARACAEPMRRALERGQRAPYEVVDALKVRWVEADELRRWDPDLLSFFNINSEADMERAMLLAEKH